MIDFIRDNKAFAGLLLGIIALVGVYFAYNSGGSDKLLTSTGTASPTAAVSKELLTTLANLRSLSLDTSLFGDSVFVSLVDFGTEIPPLPIGRPNPFAPLNGFGVRPTNTTSTGNSTTVIIPSKTKK